ncbi:MAG: glycoside hydrolase family 92 protein, partial [Acidobacteriota bacterium]|nr:glycoside hydrolase family 92 protein [Acidobacteriota bacterium]
DESAARVRQILDTLYAPRPDGLSGNEDCGQMSSWYAFAAIGLYPVVPCSDEYVVGVPLFDKTVLRLENERRFTIRTKGEGAYIKSATLRGETLTRSFLRYKEITRGGELVLTLGDQPGESWGRVAEDRPNSRVDTPRVLAAPFLVSESDRFRESLTVELASGDANATIRYATDPDAAVETWKRYEGPLELRESARIRFLAQHGELRSPIVESYLHRIPNDWTVELESIPNPQYTAGGPLALVDGLPGDTNWRTGGWLGFQYTDFEATVDLGEQSSLRRVGASFLQDQRSWIWMPAEVVVSISIDGEEFREVARMTPGVAPDAEGIVLREMVTNLPTPSEARFVRVYAKSFGEIPDWHPGRGDGAFIFIDEIIVE